MNADYMLLSLQLTRLTSWIKLRLKNMCARVGVVRLGGTGEGSKKISPIPAAIMAVATYRALRKGSHELYYLHRDQFGVPDIVIFIGIGRESWRVSKLAVDAFPEREMI